MTTTPTKDLESTFPEAMEFRRQWRTYQARLLDRLDYYLEDNKLHIVAAPGSGKTILGLEVVRRIDKPTLILAPTITIRDQWAERLVQHFLPEGSSQPSWVSIDIRQPKELTIATYQALHALCSGEREQADDISIDDEGDGFSDPANADGKGNGDREIRTELPGSLLRFKTLVVDEAHHLKAEWWRTLTFVADRLRPTVVALTATPPYDVTPAEWQRYEDLCGPVDAEVAVPELVLQGDLWQVAPVSEILHNHDRGAGVPPVPRLWGPGRKPAEFFLAPLFQLITPLRRILVSWSIRITRKCLQDSTDALTRSPRTKPFSFCLLPLTCMESYMREQIRAPIC